MSRRTLPRVRGTRHTPCSRLAGVLSVGLALTVGGLRSGGEPAPWVVVLVGAVVLAGTAAGVKLWRDNCFESRLVVVVLAVLTAAGQTLASTVGAPGGEGAHWRATAVLVVALAVAIPILVAADTRQRGRAVEPEPPYAL
ncbi:hypothetical protein [Terrabacter sp. NPDC080008]|uniref:hypothetical protein n=1 Tax=Terrabacter sp. NPDC080008 TaxID=3155176 RepID=UPI00344DCD3E